MAYSEDLAGRVRDLLADRSDVVEQKMFGGLVFMVGGRMACGPYGDRLLVRLGEDAARRHIGLPHVGPMDMSSRVMKNFAVIEPDGLRTRTQLKKWVSMSVEFATSDEQSPPARVGGSVAKRQAKPPG